MFTLVFANAPTISELQFKNMLSSVAPAVMFNNGTDGIALQPLNIPMKVVPNEVSNRGMDCKE